MLDDLDIPEDGRLAENITHFARALRKAGMPVGPERVLNAIRAVEAAGFTEREDFYFTLQACFVSKPEQLELFHQTFGLYWRDPQFLERMMRMLSPLLRQDTPREKPKAAEKRAAEALLEDPPPPEEAEAPEEEELVVDAALTMSDDERLRTMDFEQMTLAELADAKRAIQRIDLPVKPILSRRTLCSTQGARSPTGERRCAGRCGPAAMCRSSSGGRGGRDTRTSSPFVTSRGRWRAIRG